jgi:MoaA/NifB/PqqE/SkfB family radical SAM enzyme
MGVECLGLELTNRCDLQCGHCLRKVVAPNSPGAHDIPLELVKRLVSESKAAGVPHVGMTGGEPMLHPHFLEIIDHIVDEGLTYHFLSNGLGLPTFMPKFLARPERRAKLRDVCISLDGAREATHDAIRGKGMWKRTLAGVAVLRAFGVPFTFLHTITRVSHQELGQLALLSHRLGAKQLILAHFLPSGRPHATDELDLTTDERLAAEHEVKLLVDAMRFPVIMAEGYQVKEVDHECGTTAGRSLNVDPRGHLTFCCELSNFHGDERSPADRPDFIVDLREVSVAQAMSLMDARVARFRADRLALHAAGDFTDEDWFACRHCVKHFGKPREFVQIRRRPARMPDSTSA